MSADISITPDPTIPDKPRLDPTGFIRTYVPWAVGAVLGFLVLHVPIVAQGVAWLDKNLPEGFDWHKALNAAVIGAVTFLYYWVARKVGQKYPKVEAVLLGSSATPTYSK